MDALVKLLSFRVRVGRLSGVDVFLHWTLLLAAAWIFLALRAQPSHALLLVMVLGGSVLAHELGHCWGARAVGGGARELILWPLGGLASVQAPQAPLPQLVAAAAGPLVNVALLLLALPAFLATGGGWSLPTPGPVGGPPFLAMVVGVNAALAFFNLIPAYPMDGGRVLQAALWPRLGRDRATHVALGAALVVAAVLGAWALVAREALLFAVTAVVGLTALAERERLRGGRSPAPGVEELQETDGDRDDDVAAADDVAVAVAAADDDVAAADDAPGRAGPIAAWRERRRLQRLEAEARSRIELRGRLDEVLARVTACGLAGLTPDERLFLEHASRMLRREQESGKL